MRTTPEFLDAVKAAHNLPSDYALAIALGITRSSVSKLRNGKDCLGDETAEKVAELLGIEPAYVVACCHAERAKKPSQRRLWETVAEKFAHAAMLATVAALPFLADPSSPLCIMSNRRAR